MGYTVLIHYTDGLHSVNVHRHYSAAALMGHKVLGLLKV